MDVVMPKTFTGREPPIFLYSRAGKYLADFFFPVSFTLLPMLETAGQTSVKRNPEYWGPGDRSPATSTLSVLNVLTKAMP